MNLPVSLHHHFQNRFRILLSVHAIRKAPTTYRNGGERSRGLGFDLGQQQLVLSALLEKQSKRTAMSVSRWRSHGVSKDTPTLQPVLVTACPLFDTVSHSLSWS